VNTLNLSQQLVQTFTATIDRPIGSHHPEWGFEYKLNYGYIACMPAPDGEDQDVYVVGVEEPLQSFTGVCIAVILRVDDVEGKLVLAPVNVPFSREQIAEAVAFQERFFMSQVILPGDTI
jgi:inorganic pyrophosphatase